MRKIFLAISALVIGFMTLSGQTCTLFGGGGDGVYRSIDGGKTWQSVRDLAIKGESSENPPARVFSITVDSSNPDIIYVGTLGYGVYKSENRGRTWKRINDGIILAGERPAFYDIAVDPKNGDNVYLAGIINDYGKIYKSTDGGAEWREVFVEAQAELPVYSLAISTKDPKIIIAGSISGGVYASRDRGETWQHAGWFKEVISVAINNQNNDILYAATRSHGAYRSDDFGRNWTEITTKVGPDKTVDSNVNGVALGKMAVAPSDGNILYAGTTGGIYRTENGGRTWELLSTTLPTQDSPLTSDIEVNPKNPNIIYFSVPNVVYRAENAGNKWISAQLSIDARVNRIAIDPKNPNVVYAGVGK